ncbi:unnamed protein product [Somion occarium]|uniref:Uncharacterized protein n=1 Tax=Somion occarium TaxID=3059160 RepID=A0ABP1DHS9_9APHY
MGSRRLRDIQYGRESSRIKLKSGMSPSKSYRSHISPYQLIQPTFPVTNIESRTFSIVWPYPGCSTFFNSHLEPYHKIARCPLGLTEYVSKLSLALPSAYVVHFSTKSQRVSNPFFIVVKVDPVIAIYLAPHAGVAQYDQSTGRSIFVRAFDIHGAIYVVQDEAIQENEN